MLACELMTHRHCFVLAAVVTLPVLGCGAAPFNEAGYKHPLHPLAVPYADAASHSFISRDWRLDNYTLDEDGVPDDAKSGHAYRMVRRIDCRGNGSRERFSGPRFELKLLHRSHAGVIWMGLIPLDFAERELALRVFLDRYVEALAGTGFFAEDLPNGRVDVRLRRFASKVLATRVRRIGDAEALEATIELANVEQLQLDPKARQAKIRVVFSRHQFPVPHPDPDPSACRPPLLMIAGYWNAPTDFDASTGDFEKFVQSIRVGSSQTPASQPSSQPH